MHFNIYSCRKRHVRHHLSPDTNICHECKWHPLSLTFPHQPVPGQAVYTRFHSAPFTVQTKSSSLLTYLLSYLLSPTTPLQGSSMEAETFLLEVPHGRHAVNICHTVTVIYHCRLMANRRQATFLLFSL